MVGDILQPTHLLFILVVALLVLGPKRLPEVGRTLGTGLRDFRSAINGESVHEDRTPHAYVETEEPEPVPPHDFDAAPTEPTGFGADAEQTDAHDGSTHDVSVVVEDPGDATATPASALHEHDPLDAEAADDDLHAPATVDLRATNTPDVAPATAASSGGFASALASSRQRTVDDGEPAADDE